MILLTWSYSDHLYYKYVLLLTQTAATNSRFWAPVSEASLLHSRSSSSVFCIPTNKSILTEKYPPDKTTTTSTWRRGRRACTMFGITSQTRFPSKRHECQVTDGYHVDQVYCSGEQREKRITHNQTNAVVADLPFREGCLAQKRRSVRSQ